MCSGGEVGGGMGSGHMTVVAEGDVFFFLLVVFVLFVLKLVVCKKITHLFPSSKYDGRGGVGC